MGMALTDPAEFNELISSGAIVADDDRSDTPAGREWLYVRMIDAQSVQFAAAIRKAAERANNVAEYPAGNALAASLAVVARLIAGGLETPVYVVSLGGFDTHAGQAIVHPALLMQLSSAVAAFADDLDALNLASRVVAMTVSEFGRRPAENGSGTDHGSAAPHFVFGAGIDGGKIHGGLPDLHNLNSDGNLRHTIDFRCYYASVLAPYFGLDDVRIGEILPLETCGSSRRLLLYRTSTAGRTEPILRTLSID